MIILPCQDLTLQLDFYRKEVFNIPQTYDILIINVLFAYHTPFIISEYLSIFISNLTFSAKLSMSQNNNHIQPSVSPTEIKFIFTALPEKLILEATILKDNATYVGQIEANPYVDFDFIKEIIEENQFSVLIKNQNALKIKVGPVVLELKVKPKSEINDLKEKIKVMEENQKKLQETVKQLKSQVEKFKFTTPLRNLIPLNLPIGNVNWSLIFKSSCIKIKDKTATLINSEGDQFALVEVGFSKRLQQRQCWGIKVKNQIGWIQIGVCLKNVMEKYKFNSQGFKWGRPGHGCHLIDSNGYTFCNSSEEFEDAPKSFTFKKDDVIFVEYDPIECKLRFQKNLDGDKIEMPIAPPSTDDAYYPCVSLANSDSSVELILPGIAL